MTYLQEQSNASSASSSSQVAAAAAAALAEVSNGTGGEGGGDNLKNSNLPPSEEDEEANNNNNNNNNNKPGINPIHNADDDKMRFQRWLTIYPYYPIIAQYAQRAYQFCTRWISGTFRYNYRTLADAFHSFFAIQSPNFASLYNILPEEFFYDLSFIHFFYQKTSLEIQQECCQLHSHLQHYLTIKREKAEWQRLQILLQTNVHRPTEEVVVEEEGGGGGGDDSSVMMKLKRLGITNADAQQMSKLMSREKDIDSLLEGTHSEYYEKALLSLKCLEFLQKYCIGIHSIDVFSGKSRLTMSLTDCNIFELLPVMPPVNRMAIDHDRELARIRSGKQGFKRISSLTK
jgi:hypothetical protein